MRAAERDVALDLDREAWPGPIVIPDYEPKPDEVYKWEPHPEEGYFSRRVEMEPIHRKQQGVELEEKLLRFPSAPIHGLHRLSQDEVNMGPVEDFHTYRLLSKPGRRGKVSRIFLMHNGLNETQRQGLYYQLASYLIEHDPGTVCILRPFPGHLSRSAYPGLSETPLDHYLWDGLHLFRQFLRYMIETRWLLSTIARYSYYHCVSGSGLLGESSRIPKSRLRTASLAKDMRDEWERLNEASKKAVKGQEATTPKLRDKPPPPGAFRQAIDSLRGALRLDLYPESNGSTFEARAEPELHAIGYSLGGFTAQSVFMSWPFLVSSCSTLLSGGAMRELAPTAFADPEEWQTVLHSLHYELDDAMMDFRFAADEDGLVAGMEPGLFRYLKRTFYEVFEQEYRGSFQTRLVSFRQRMLFVVGGNDPIVRPQSVLDSGPPDGINLLAVGGIGHFLEGVAQGTVEGQQRDFWLPEVGHTIGQLAADAAIKHRTDLRRTWLDEDDLIKEKALPKGKKKWKELKRLEIAERLKVEQDGKLENDLFQRALDDLLVRVSDDESTEEEKGLLFVLKNEPPTFLLRTKPLQQRANALYHEDVSITGYVRGVSLRGAVVDEARDRICVVLPWNVPTIMTSIDAGLQHPSQSESSGEQEGFAEHPPDTWRNLSKDCKGWASGSDSDCIRVFDGRKGPERLVNERVDEQNLQRLNEAACAYLRVKGEVDQVIPALPDCWVWMSNDFLGRSPSAPAPTIQDGIQDLCREVPRYLPEKPKEKEAKERAMAERLRSDSLRLLSLSRARYNPRFRGRIVAEPRQAQELLLRLSLCIVSSVPFESFPFEEPA